MSGERYMLDTDILVFMLRGLKLPDAKNERRVQAERIRKRIEQKLRAGSMIYISTVTVCELEYGATKADDPGKERRALYKILAPFELLGCDAMKMPRLYGEIRRNLEESGKPIGSMDLLIAAHALAAGAILVSNNVKEFSKVKGLQAINWARV